MDAHILSLRYSLFLSASEMKNNADAKYRREKEQIHYYSDILPTIQQKISELTQKLSAETENYNRTIGRKEMLLGQIHFGLNKLAVRITVMLDEQYSAEDIHHIRSGYTAQLTEAVTTQQAYENEEQQLQQELADQDTKREELIQQQADIKAQLEYAKADYSQYQEAYNVAMQVMAHLSLPAERLFSCEPLSCLETIIGQLQEQLRKAGRLFELLAEQLKCIENGQLHVSKTAVSFLQETGISFQTGEHYLLHQSPEIRETILAVNPLVAYAVIVDSAREQEKLLCQTTDDTWLSAIVPIYTLSELADMADKKWNKPVHFISAYDKIYFSNASAYLERVRAKLKDVQIEVQNIKHQIEEWQSERNVLVQFSYSTDDEQKMLAQVTSCQERLHMIQNALSNLDSRRNKIHGRIKELRKVQNKQQEQIRIINSNRSKFESICDAIKQYERLCTEITEYETNCKQLSDSIKYTHSKEKQTAEQIQTCKMKIQILEKNLAEYRSLMEELKDTPEADLLSDAYPIMLEEYRLYQFQRSSDRQSLQKQIENVQRQIEKIKTDLSRFKINPEEYEKVTYSDAAYHHTEEQHSHAEQAYMQAGEAYTKAVGDFRIAENNLKQAEGRLKELNVKLLERSEVGSDFERRIEECETALNSANTGFKKCRQLSDELNSDKKITAKYAVRFQTEIKDYTPRLLEEPVDANDIYDKIVECIRKLSLSEKAAKKYHHCELEPFRSGHSSFTGTIDGIVSVIGNTQINGDRYYTLYERTEDDIRRYRKRIEQLTILLKDVEDSRKQLVHHCIQRVGRLYENLIVLSKKSGVQINDSKKQMIKINLPVIEQSSSLPTERLNQYLKEQVKKFLQEAADKRCNHLDIRRLLNCYIGKESIPIIVFKIDKNAQNSRYRTWEAAIKANSVGEQCVVLFSLVAAVMNYTRSMTANLNHTSGVLILDNPFGAISSPHLLEPMFRMAHHFHIQLICLTHLGTAAVTSCFDMVYQLRFKNLPLSTVEILESEAKQHMEHTYYLSEQLSLF